MSAPATKTFASLLRKSKFITQGDFRNATMVGRVFHVTKNDLYVDFGLKFHAVVPKPSEETKLYARGSMVELRLLDYEITDKFIGSEGFTSILEADAKLLNLVSTPVGKGTKDITRTTTRTSTRRTTKRTTVK